MVRNVKDDGKQPEINIGLIGHVDHGKTTLTERLTGKWTDTHSEELKRGITIRLGYADATFYYCKKCGEYSTEATCKNCKTKGEISRRVSFVDAPGHETLMATMLSGAAIMDGALLLIAANEKCPQPQTKEHLMALEIIGVKQIVIVQNKIDLVSKEDAIKNYKEIKEFVKGTIAENAPIIPISAQHNVNINILIKTIEETIKTPKKDINKEPIFLIARSFDVNRPGTEIDNLVGGVLGGALKQGVLKIGDEIEIKPGIKKDEKEEWQPLHTKIIGLKSGDTSLETATAGGSIGILTLLDPAIVKSDSLTGSILGLKGKLPDVLHELKLKQNLLKRVVGTREELEVENIKQGEVLMLNVNSAATIGTVISLEKNSIKVRLKIPVCATKNDKVTIARRIGTRWRLIGWGEII